MIFRKDLAILLSFLLLIPVAISVNVLADNQGTSVFSTIPKVLFDNTKKETAGNADWTFDGAYSDFARALRQNLSAQVDPLNSGPITLAKLSSYNVYVIPEAQNPFTASETTAILQWVSQGGGLLLIADHNGSDRDNDGWDSPHIYNTFLNSSKNFGIAFTYNDKSQAPITNVQSSSVTQGVTSMGYWNGCTMNVSGNATAHIWLSSSNGGGATVVTSTFGNGLVAALGDSSVFDDGTPDKNNTGDNLYNGWAEYSDARLGVNLVSFLIGSGGPISEFGISPMAGLLTLALFSVPFAASVCYRKELL